MRYRKVRTISGKGPGANQFAEALRGIGIDRAGMIYAAGDSEIKVFDAQAELQTRWRTDRPGYCVAIDDDGTVYVGEAGQLEIFDTAGKRLTTWQDADRLGLVTTIGFFREHVLVADAQDRCIRRYDTRGQWLNDIGKNNTTKGFLIPNGHVDFAVDAQGIIHAPNPAKHRVERYDLTGDLLGHFGRFGGRRPEDFPGCCNPTNLTLDRQGHVIVTEKAGPRLKVYSPVGKLLAVVGAEAFDANCKNMDVAVDSLGNVYVVDTVRLHICVFAPEQTDGGSAAGSTSPDTPGVVEP
jgi:sugar lactone lactonase YvrE